MGLSLILAMDSSLLTPTINILKVAIGLGMVIFVHELGHFVVAKLCGVKCEKFYLGFDIAGLKLAKFVWGETEYGIGILPLGGYVKMLGQEDNPARLREEIERAKAHAAAEADPPPSGSAAEKDTVNADSENQAALDRELAKAQQALYDPRSYLAKSVPKRMAIISAGVVMNVIFAFVAAVMAYGFGVEQLAPVVGAVVPGAGAWQAGVEVGDRILQIGDTPVRTFMDLRSAVSLGNNEDGVSILIQRPGENEPFRLVAKAEKTGLAPTVGIGSPSTTVLRTPIPVLPGTPAAKAKPPFQSSDRIVAIDEKPVSSYAEIYRNLAAHSGQTLAVTVEREAPQQDRSQADTSKLEQVTIQVAPAPMRTLGLVMQMGPIAAIQANSPAATSPLKPGDILQQIDGEPVGDPMTLPDRLASKAKDRATIRMSVLSKNAAEPVEFELTLRPMQPYDSLVPPDGLVSLPAIGIAYEVDNKVAAVTPDGPAAKAGIKVGDVVDQAAFLRPSDESLRQNGLEEIAKDLPEESPSIDLASGEFTWPYLINRLQVALPDTRVELTLSSGQPVILEPVRAEHWFNPGRGFVFNDEEFQQRATSLGDAMRLGSRETLAALTVCFRTVQRLLDNQVSPKALSGPIGIAKMAYYSAAEGSGRLMIFLAFLSANLAVLNFLPIPVLDGGHMVFLAYEGITGRPPSERVQLSLTYLGLLLLLGLMVWVIGLDVGWISRH